MKFWVQDCVLLSCKKCILRFYCSDIFVFTLSVMECLQPKCTLHSTVIYLFTFWWQWLSCGMQPAHQDWKPFTHALTAHSGTAQHWGSEPGSKDSWMWTLQELRIKNTHLATSERPLYYQPHWKKAALVNLVPEEEEKKNPGWHTVPLRNVDSSIADSSSVLCIWMNVQFSWTLYKRQPAILTESSSDSVYSFK